MSNSTRQGGHDERFVVPLEASRRGAHRARVNPLLAVLPLVAVAAVVVGVVVLAYTLLADGLFGGDDAASGPSPVGTSRVVEPGGTAAPAPGGSTDPAPGTSDGAQPSDGADPSDTSSAAPSSPRPSASRSVPARVDKDVTLQIYNGSQVKGLSRDAKADLAREGWTLGEPANWERSRVRTTTVFYAEADQAATARAVVADLGTGVARLDPDLADGGIAVVVYTDWSP